MSSHYDQSCGVSCFAGSQDMQVVILNHQSPVMLPCVVGVRVSLDVYIFSMRCDCSSRSAVLGYIGARTELPTFNLKNRDRTNTAL